MLHPSTPPDRVVPEALALGAAVRIRARGSSMLPFVRDGDVVVIGAVPAHEVRVGDVVCYRPCPGRLMIHRVVDRVETGLIVRGDALRWADVVAPSAILGRAIAVERRGRTRRLDGWWGRRANHVATLVSPSTTWLVAAVLGARRTWRALQCRPT